MLKLPSHYSEIGTDSVLAKGKVIGLGNHRKIVATNNMVLTKTVYLANYKEADGLFGKRRKYTRQDS